MNPQAARGSEAIKHSLTHAQALDSHGGRDTDPDKMTAMKFLTEEEAPEEAAVSTPASKN